MMDIVAFDGCNAGGGGGGGVAITVVLNYSALPDPATVPNTYYWAEQSEGTKWLPSTLGGTYHNSGLYYSNGTEWQHSETPFQCTIAEINTGTNNTRFVTPYTFSNSTKIVNSFQKNVDDTDDITEGAVNKFVPLYINDATKYLDSFGNWTVPANSPMLFGGAKKNNTTDTYLMTHGVYTNLVPFELPTGMIIDSISASSDGASTWDAEIHGNGSLIAGASLSLTAVDSDTVTGLNISVTLGTKLSLYCKGTNVKSPRIFVTLKNSN